MTAASRPVIGAASLAGYNLGAVGKRLREEPEFIDELLQVFGPSLAPLQHVPNRDLFQETERHADVWDVRRHARELSAIPLLLMAARRDPAVPAAEHYDSLVDAIRGNGSTSQVDIVLDADHAFSDQRVALTTTVLDWLDALAETDRSTTQP